jgi:hypothetical protein
MGLYALEEVKKGKMRWEEWLPDGLHPQSRGSLSYGASVISFLEKEIGSTPFSEKILCGENMPLPLKIDNWENARLFPLANVKLQGPWHIRRSSDLVWMDQILYTAAVGAKLSFVFSGRGLCLGFDFGKSSSEFRYQLDNNDWVDVIRERPDWCGMTGWFRMHCIADDLELGEHEFKLEVTHGNRPDCTGTNFSLAFIGVI